MQRVPAGKADGICWMTLVRVGIGKSGNGVEWAQSRRRSGPEVHCGGFLWVQGSTTVLTSLLFLDAWCHGSHLQILVLFGLPVGEQFPEYVSGCAGASELANCVP